MMTRLSLPSHALMLGFDELEKLIERTAKSAGEGYPPYNIERLEALRLEVSGLEVLGLDREPDGTPEMLRITLAVAGFQREHLDIQLDDRQLTIRGRQADDSRRQFIHRGIATRQFSRTFVLADGLEVRTADLDNGLLTIDLVRLAPPRQTRTIEIGNNKSSP